MTTTFQKRQKEMKRLEKRRLKEQKRAQRKTEKIALKESGQIVSDIEPTATPSQGADTEGGGQ